MALTKPGVLLPPLLEEQFRERVSAAVTGRLWPQLCRGDGQQNPKITVTLSFRLLVGPRPSYFSSRRVNLFHLVYPKGLLYMYQVLFGALVDHFGGLKCLSS